MSNGLTKEDRVPPREINLAVERKAAFESDPAGHTYSEKEIMKGKTTDAVEILRRRAMEDPKLQALYEEEKINFQAALAFDRPEEQRD